VTTRAVGPAELVARAHARLGRVLARVGDERLFALCLLGLAAAITVFLVAPLTPGFAVMHELPTNRDVHVEGKEQGGVTGFWLLSVTSFLVAVWRWRRGGRPSWRLLVGGAVLLHLLALLVPPVASEDVYAYSFYGAVQRDYGVNPYLAFPAQHPLHPWFPFWSWRGTGPVYGPPFLLLLRGVAVLAGPSLLAWVVWMKVLLVAAEAVGIWVLVRALRPAPGAAGETVGEAPQSPGWPVLLLAWNPMVLQSIAMSAHVDALLLLVVALAVLAHRRGRHLAAFTLLAACFVIKLYMGPLALLYALWLTARRRPGRRLATFAGLGGLGTLVTAVAHLPYASAGSGVLTSVLFVGEHFSSGSLGNIVRRLLTVVGQWGGMSQTGATAFGDRAGRLLAMGAVLAWLAACAVRTWRRAEREPGFDPLPALATYFLGYLLLTPWVLYWHEIPLLALVAAVPWSLTSLAALLFGLTLLPATVGGRAGVGAASGDGRQLLNTLSAFANRYGAPVVVLLGGWWLERHRRRRPEPRPPGDGHMEAMSFSTRSS
jgi:hypothetical protein